MSGRGDLLLGADDGPLTCGTRCKGIRPRSSTPDGFGPPDARARSARGLGATGLGEELLGVHGGRAAPGKSRQHVRELGHALGVLEHVDGRGAPSLLHADVPIGERGDLREVGNHDDLPVARP